MKLINFVAPRPQFSDNNGSPLAFGRVSFYEAGTTTLKEVYTTADKTTGAQNPHELNQGGFVRDGGIWLDEGRYTILVESSDGAGGWVEDYTIEDIPGTGEITTGLLTSAIVTTIQDLRNLDAGQFQMVFVAGYYEPHDRGEGWFIWEENNSDADNGGTIINSSGAPAFGRWVRLIQQAEIIPQIFGGMEATAFGVASNFQSMIDWCNQGGNEEYRKITIPTGGYFLDGNVDFNGGIDLEMSDQTFFTSHPATSGTLTITCHKVDVNKKTLPLVLSDITLVFNPSDVNIRTNPRWYGDANFENFTQCVTTSGSRELDIYSGLNIENTATGTLFVSGMHWHGDVGGNNVFNIESTNLNITIDEIFVESERDSEIFTNEFRNVRILKGQPRVSWFNFTTGLKFEDLLFSITDGNTNQKQLIWDESKTISGEMTEKYEVDHVFLSGNIIAATGQVDLFTISAGSYRIFDETQSGRYVIRGGAYKAQWFGAIGNAAVSSSLSQNVVSFNKMFNSYLYPIKIDGEGMTFWFNNSILYDGVGILKLENITLNVAGFSGNFFNLFGDSFFKKVDFNGRPDKFIFTNDLNKNHDFINCSFNNDDSSSIKDIDIKGGNLVTSISTFTNCNFLYTNLIGTNFIVNSSIFDRSNIEIYRDNVNIETVVEIRNNTFITRGSDLSRIHINCIQPSSKVIGLWIIGNYWRDFQGQLGASYNAIYSTNTDVSGHYVDIFLNSAFTNFTKIPTTRPKGVYQAFLPSQTGSFNIELTADQYFLPTTGSPISGYVVGAGQDDFASTARPIYVSFNSKDSSPNSLSSFPNVSCYASGAEFPLISFEFINSKNINSSY